MLEFLFVITLFAGVAVILNYQYEDMTRTLAEVMKKTFLLISTNELLITSLVFLGIAALFGYIISYIALKPTRDALASQKQFIGNVAHELRTPLSIIKTNIEVALLEGRLDSKLREALLGNVDELDRTSDIINNLLSLNTLLNPERVEFTNVDLGDVVDAALVKLSALAHQKNIKLFITRAEFLLVSGNSTALEQVAMNLIKNAIIYTPQGGRVDISIAPNYYGHIELRIRDTGIGISREDIFHVFEPFYRADRSRARAHGGSGLGLTIVSELVKLHRGKITIQSTEKQGTTVVVSLPVGKVPGSNTNGSNKENEGIAIDFSHYKHPAHPTKK
jgi:signal transduction histidine kinase